MGESSIPMAREEEWPLGGPRAFQTTHWSRVLAAGRRWDSRAGAALADLFRSYAYPLYAFARRQGAGHEDAQDLVQGFFAGLVETSGLRHADPQRGRFRSYLLGAFKHYVQNLQARDRAQKRGGGKEHLALDLETARGRYAREPADPETPEKIYERRWAQAVLERALAGLREESRAAGREEAFELLKGYLVGEGERGSYRTTARSLGLSEGALRVAVHRLRKRFAERLRGEVAATVNGQREVSKELSFLLEALRSGGRS